MGKGDQRSRRGKIYRGSYGSRRPKDRKKREEEQPRAKKPTKK